MVQIGSKVDALDALRLKEHFATKSMLLGTVDGGCGVRIGANLVFLQDQLSHPLTRARLENAPMSSPRWHMIRSGWPSLRSGIAVRPSARKPRLSGFDINLSGHRKRSSQQRISWKSIEVILRTAAQCLAFYRVGRFPSHCSCQLTPAPCLACLHRKYRQGQSSFGAGSCSRRNKVSACYRT